ncbi:MAG: NAD-dependent epimerase/dehydratase family protein [Candidatus Omnitrophica bacterium]|nr:NAD-dependent epimerase/dehydratase family protein [Candidatus Omnitrophota bacterium]
MTILVTGGAGMVGSHCAEHFSKKNHQVIVYDNLMRSQIFRSQKESVEYNWHYLKTLPKIILEKNDIRDRAALKKCFQQYKPDVVIHAAAQPGVRFSLDNPYEDFEINCVGTVNVLEAFREVNPQGTLIYCSTNKVYGENINNYALVEKKSRYTFKKEKGVSEKESVDLTGHTPYGTSKLAGEQYVQDYAHTYGLKTGVFRMSCIYGTRQFGFEDQGWLAWFSICALQNRDVTIYGDGKQVRDVLWVEDLIRAYEKFINSDSKHEVFNIGGGPENTLSLLELVAILEEILSKKIKVGFDDWRKFDQKVYISNIDKIKREMGWAPEVSVKEGLKRLTHWIKENPEVF